MNRGGGIAWRCSESFSSVRPARSGRRPRSRRAPCFDPARSRSLHSARTDIVHVRAQQALASTCPVMQAFLVSLGAVALAEIGDKTQLLSLVLAAKYRRPLPICLGVLVATLLNHAIAA